MKIQGPNKPFSNSEIPNSSQVNAVQDKNYIGLIPTPSQKTEGYNLTDKKFSTVTEIKKEREFTETHLPEVIFPKTLEEKQKMCDQFKVGDVIVERMVSYKSLALIDVFISVIQQLSKFLGFARENADSRAIHIAVVVGVDREKGRVLISEAMPSSSQSGLRTVDFLSHSACILKKDSEYNYQLFRPNTPYAATAVKAAAIAKRFAPKVSYLKESTDDDTPKDQKYLNKFTYTLALKSMFKKDKSFDFDAQKRTLKGIFETAVFTNVSIGDKTGRNLYCSAFGSQVFQKAFAEEAWNELIIKHPDLQKGLEELVMKTSKLTHYNENRDVTKWAREVATQYGKELGDHMKAFKIDFKHTTPQDLVAYFHNDNIAAPILNIVPPAA